MVYGKVKNNFYGFGEFPEDNEIAGGDNLQWNGNGATGNVFFRLPIGKSCLVTWGDGNTSNVVGAGVGVNTIVTNNYLVNQLHIITISGDVDTVALFQWTTNVKIQGSVGAFTDWLNLARLIFSGTSINDNIEKINHLPLTELSAASTALEGDLLSLNTLNLLTTLAVNNSAISTYTAGVLPNWDACTISVQDLGLLVLPVSNFLIDLNTSSIASVKTCNIGGTNVAPNAAGLVAVGLLVGKGWTMIHS